MRRCFPLHFLIAGGKKTVYQRAKVAVRDPKALLSERVKDNLHVEYPAEEVARRMTKVRLRHARAEGDAMERVMLQGEYKYFTGKKVHFLGASAQALISLLQNFAYFGFYSTHMLDQVVIELHRRVQEVDATEIMLILRCLSQLSKIQESFLDDLSLRLLRILSTCTHVELGGILEALDVSQSFSYVLLERIFQAVENTHSLEMFPMPHVAALSACIGRASLARSSASHPNRPGRTEPQVMHTQQSLCHHIFTRTQALLDRPQELTLDDAAKIFWGLAYAGYLDATLHLPVLQRFVARIGGAQLAVPEGVGDLGAALANLVECLHVLQCFHEHIVMHVALTMQTQCEELTLPAAAAAMHYLAVAAHRDPALVSVLDVGIELLRHTWELNYLGDTMLLSGKTRILAALAAIFVCRQRLPPPARIRVHEARALQADHLWSLLRGILVHRPSLQWTHLHDVLEAMVHFECLHHEPTVTLLLDRVHELQRSNCALFEESKESEGVRESAAAGSGASATHRQKENVSLHNVLTRLRVGWRGKPKSADLELLFDTCSRQGV